MEHATDGTRRLAHVARKMLKVLAIGENLCGNAVALALVDASIPACCDARSVLTTVLQKVQRLMELHGRRSGFRVAQLESNEKKKISHRDHFWRGKEGFRALTNKAATPHIVSSGTNAGNRMECDATRPSWPNKCWRVGNVDRKFFVASLKVPEMHVMAPGGDEWLR